MHDLEAGSGLKVGDDLAARLAAFTAHGHCLHCAVERLLPLDRTHRNSVSALLHVWLLELQAFGDGRLEYGHVAELEVQLAAVLLGDVLNVDVLLEGLFHVLVGEDEDLGDGNRVEPTLDPAPDGGKEGGRADDLQKSGSVNWGADQICGRRLLVTHKYSIQRLWVMSGSQLTGILHVTLEIPELLQTNF